MEDEKKDQMVKYHVVCCPNCGSEKTRIVRSGRDIHPIRYHKCYQCDHNFKSVQENQSSRS